MKFYYRHKRPIHLRLNEDDVFKFQLDITQWQEENGTVTAAPTATVRSGDVTVGTPAVSSGVITMTLSQTSEGSSRVELKWTDGTYTAVQNIYVKYEDHETAFTDGYEL